MDDTTVVVASRDIHVGEQLFLSYIDQKQKYVALSHVLDLIASDRLFAWPGLPSAGMP